MLSGAVLLLALDLHGLELVHKLVQALTQRAVHRLPHLHLAAAVIRPQLHPERFDLVLHRLQPVLARARCVLNLTHPPLDQCFDMILVVRVETLFAHNVQPLVEIAQRHFFLHHGRKILARRQHEVTEAL